MRTPQTPRPCLLPLLLAVVALLSPGLSAQLTPDRLYFGVGQRVVVTVEAPQDFAGDLTIKIHDPKTQAVLMQAPAAQGRVDLTSLFPMIWSEKSDRVVLAQLYLDSTPTGAPLVLQPLVTPNTAALVDPGTLGVSEDEHAEVMFTDDRLASKFAKHEVDSMEREKIYSGLRVYIDQEAVVHTSEGDIVFRLRPDAAPNTAFNFMQLVEGGFYTNIIFHRVVAKLTDGRPFVIQVGDPSGTGSGGPGYTIDLEKSTLAHDLGVLSMARSTDPNTNGSQVFVCLSREGTAFLDGRYTAFAQAVSGAEVVRAIAAVPVDADDRPLDPPMIDSAELRPAPPVPMRPAPLSAAPGAQESSDGPPDEPDR